MSLIRHIALSTSQPRSSSVREMGMSYGWTLEQTLGILPFGAQAGTSEVVCGDKTANRDTGPPDP
jgi:hypothetical protein